MSHPCLVPIESKIGSVWVCHVCGHVWEAVGQWRVQTPGQPIWYGVGQWVRTKDTKAPKWARKEQKEVRRGKPPETIPLAPW